ncbi:unnamed protein product, partial [marine sediment metagenome]
LRARSKLFRDPQVTPQMRMRIYDFIAPRLARECYYASPRVNFPAAFPEPPGMDAHRRAIKQSAKPTITPQNR